MNKEALETKQESLQKSLENLLQQQAQVAEQISMHRGAMQYNAMLMKEMADEAAKAAEAAPAELKSVPAGEPAAK